MDIDALHSTLLSIALLTEKLRSTRHALPVSGSLQSTLGEFLDEMERDLQIAKATLAGELGFRLCPRCWPPELVSIDLAGRLNCPACGEIAQDRAA